MQEEFLIASRWEINGASKYVCTTDISQEIFAYAF